MVAVCPLLRFRPAFQAVMVEAALERRLLGCFSPTATRRLLCRDKRCLLLLGCKALN
ncbi:MAG: hypothetical protein ACI89J_001675 [Hyphomicrobiaceae bacterium]|jgi:hypothetical protein